MRTLALLFRFSLLVLSTLANLQAAWASTGCFSTETSGSGATLMTICISDHGNLVQFESPAGFEHLRTGNGTIGEGYRVCALGGVTNSGYDAGFNEAGFGLPTINQPNGPNTFPLMVTRNTTNGSFQLTQTFDRNTTEKEVTIRMSLKNVSSAPIGQVALTRYFDGDIDGVADDDLYARTGNSVWGYADVQPPFGEGHGLMLTPITFATNRSVVVRKFTDWSSSLNACGAVTVEPTPTGFGDFIGEVTYFFSTLS